MKLDEKKIAIVFFAIVLLLSLIMRYKPYEYNLYHDYPVEIKSADANSRVSEAEWFVISRQDVISPSWFDDKYYNILEIEPTLSGTLAAMLSQISGMPAYDSLYFVAMLSGIGVSICIFLLFWKVLHNIWLGLIAGTLSIYPFEWFYHYQLQLGMFPHFTQLVFLMLTVLFFIKYLQDLSWKSLIGIGLMGSFAFHAHSPNAIFLLFLMGCILIYRIFKKQVKVMHLVSLVALVLAIILPYIPILMGNYLGFFGFRQGAPLQIQTDKIFTNIVSTHPVQIGNFLLPALYVFLVIGIISSFFLLKKKFYPLIVGIFLFFFAIAMLSAYFGISQSHITEKPRYMLYVFAYPVVAIGMFSVILLLKQIARIDYKIITLILVVALIGFHIHTLYTQIQSSSPSILTKESYGSYLWARENIPENSRVLCVGCVQFEAVYTHRPTFLPTYEVEPSTLDQLVDIAQNNLTKGVVNVHIMGYVDERIYRDGLGLKSYGNMVNHNESICDFDYVILKGVDQQLINVIGSKLLAKNATLIYNKDAIAMVKNNNVRGECI